MKKDRKWFVDKWTKERNKTDVHDPMYHFINEFIEDVRELDEPEVLSQEWIEEHTYYEDEYDFYYADPDELKNLLVPEQEELELQDIDQLDEPEVLSQEWIRNNQERKGVHFFVNVNKLQNLLVPKQEELESKIKVLIEAYKQEDGAYSNPENGWISGFVEDLENLVEEEQKYYVDLCTAAYVAKWNGDDQVGIYSDGVSGSDEYEFHLTEQEIKDFDPRYWAFAKPVEE